jgi:HD-like signal output (HDOD) protein
VTGHSESPLPGDLAGLARALAPEIATLPRVSRVVDRFLRDAGRDTASAEDIAAALELDEVLRGWVLRHANSGFAHLQRPVTSVGEACVVLGLQPVSRLVYAACTRDLLAHPFSRYRYPGHGFWLHALSVGTAARRLTVRLGATAPLGAEEAMVAGLLHDVGKLLLDQRLPPHPERQPSVADERAHAGVDHGLLSAAVMRTWGLPARPIAAVAGHHTEPLTPAARVIAASDLLVRHWGAGIWTYVRTDLPPPLRDLAELTGPLGVDLDALQRWCDELPPLIGGLQEMVRVLGHGTPPDLPDGAPAAAGRDGTAIACRRVSRRRRAEGRVQGRRRDRQRGR